MFFVKQIIKPEEGYILILKKCKANLEYKVALGLAKQIFSFFFQKIATHLHDILIK